MSMSGPNNESSLGVLPFVVAAVSVGASLLMCYAAKRKSRKEADIVTVDAATAESTVSSSPALPSSLPVLTAQEQEMQTITLKRRMESAVDASGQEVQQHVLSRMVGQNIDPISHTFRR